ncbi:MAG: hypothetical protein H6719_35800 [Sandaracinaceae bacterium]|nr:hypothetical protein [Sandaracinaceae bacterium]
MRRTGARAHRMRALERGARASLGLVAAGAALAATRALVWPRGDVDAALVGLPRAAALFGIGALATAFAVGLWAWRRSRVGALAAATTIDDHLGLADVVSSAYAFDVGGDPAPAAALARRRAHEVLRGYDPRQAVPRPRLRPRWRRVAIGAALAASGLGLGTLDSTVVAALVSPPTAAERVAAESLEAAAEALEAEVPEPTREHPAQADRTTPRDPSRDDDRAVAAQARQAAAATRRGDRDAALRALRQMDAARGRSTRRARQSTDRLSALASALGAPPRAGRDAVPTASERAQELARLLQRRQEPQDEERAEERERERRRTLDRLERSANRAQQAGQDDLARALERAAAAMAAGQDDQAGQAMEQAARALERMEAQLAETRMALLRQANLAEEAERAERALQLGRMGRGDEEPDAMMLGGDEPGAEGAPMPGEGGRQLSETLMNRLTALGLARGPSDDPRGTGGRSRTGRARAALPTHGDALTRSEVNGVGERAIAALEGLGANGEPTTELRDVFPSYGVQVEEALADERVPAARRRTVRRYFESIRPDADEEEEPR